MSAKTRWWLAAAALVSLPGWRGAAEPERGPVDVLIHEVTTRRDPVPFHHQTHLGFRQVGRCVECHHRQDASGEKFAKCTSCHRTREEAMQAFHGLCKGCHGRVADTGGGPKPPTNCERGGCHGFPMALTSRDARQPPVAFDHQRHRVSRALENCQRCHHKAVEDTVPQACETCHTRPDDREAAYHKLCIGCHVDAAGGQPGTAAAKCTFCHKGA